MTVDAQTVRCENDSRMFDALLATREVVRSNEQLARMADQGHVGVRRRLLATSVRLSRSMAPDVHRICDACIDRLALDIPVELYVFAGAQYNAACFKPEDGQLFVMFSSSLLESFVATELAFVIGHELGHYVYRHHDIPIGYILGGPAKPSTRLALELFAWSRYAEVSADRAGAHCARDLDGVARALFKLASGLSGASIAFSLDDFLAQVDDMQVADAAPGAGPPQEDWFLTHPFSPLRVKALKLFHDSELARDGGMAKSDLEVAVQGLMSLMEPSYMEGHTEVSEAMRRALFAGALAVAIASGDVSDTEIEVFDKFFGEGSYSGKLDIGKLRAELPARLRSVRDLASITRRMQVLRDLCVIARADDHVGAQERAVLDEIADGLDVPRRFVCQTLDARPDLD